MFIPENLLRRLDKPGPRYTSYPTADRFGEQFGAGDYAKALTDRGAHRADQPASVYVHIPFCDSVCYYCACNKIVTRHHERAQRYLVALRKEIDLHRQVLGRSQPVSQLHFGGGSPTFLSDEELRAVLADLRTCFDLTPDAEVSIEVDPRTATPERLQALHAMGFGRLSFGIQDFDPDVQKAVHRVQPYEQVRELVLAARSIGFESINADLIYGLPRQSAESFARTISQVLALRPDRIALYAYAHLPDRFKPQRRIETDELPTAATRLTLLGGAIDAFLSRGYTYIGMDHFALPTDRLAQARRQGKLHRNFQGYTTQPDNDLIGLGVSAIGHVGPCYSQNAKTLDAYYAALENNEFPTARGLVCTAADRLRHDVIMSLMCQGRVDFAQMDTSHGICFEHAFAAELEALNPLVELGVVEIDARSIHVTPLGWYGVRAIAMVFDAYLNSEASRARFSKVI